MRTVPRHTARMADDESSDRAQTATQRLFQLSRLLRRNPHTLAELMEALGGTPGGIIRRDLAELRSLEPDLHELPGRPMRYAIGTPRPSPVDRLPPADLLALHSLATLLIHRTNDQQASLQRVAGHLASTLPEHIQNVLAKAAPAAPEGKQPTRQELNLERATLAWMNRQALQFEYLKPGKRAERRTSIIQPYFIQTHPVTLDVLVIGRDTTQHGEIRTFRLAQMLNLRLAEQTYDIPADFNPRDLVHAQWGPMHHAAPSVTVELRFTGEAKYRILEGGHANLSEPLINPDASLDVTLEAPLDSSGLPRSVMPWILSWGAGVEVLGPAPLRAYWHHTLSRALDRATREPVRFVNTDVA